MKIRIICIVLAAALLILACKSERFVQACRAEVTTVIGGLTEPRSVTLSPSGMLHVAESGTAESGGRISRIEPGGVLVPVVTGLPFFLHGTEGHSGTGMAFRGSELYGVQGTGPLPLGGSIFRVAADGEAMPIAEIVKLLRGGSGRPPFPSNPFGVTYHGERDRFYVTDSAANAVISVTPAGEMSMVFEWDVQSVPTGISMGPDGDLYVALFSPFPHHAATGQIVRLTPEGLMETSVPGLTMPIGVAFDPSGAMYVLQFSNGFDLTGPGGYAPASGRLLRVRELGFEVLLEGLQFPTGLAIGSEGEIYVTLGGGLAAPGAGSVLRLNNCPIQG